MSGLVNRVKNALVESFPKPIAVVGELSNCKLHSSGHFYFRLKDADASIDAVMFRGQASRLKFRPTDGLEVVATGRVDVYDVRGQLQFYVESITPKGAGALELALRQLKDKLQAEGLFDEDRKKPLPAMPRAIGIITSATGAAIRDISRTLRRRLPAVQAYLLPVLVQGDAAAEQIASAITAMDAAAEQLAIDTIIIGRGGGSLEDLWAFNEEPVARAIAAAKTPVISGVGHEVDVTIADLVADVRAATPTAAAERAVPDRADLARHVAQLTGRLHRLVTGALAEGKAELRGLGRSAAFKDPTSRLRTAAQHVDELTLRLSAALRRRLGDVRQSLEPLAHRLAALHPARLAERARAALAGWSDRLAWALGARGKRGGDQLAELTARLQANHPRHRLALARQHVESARRELEALSYRATLARGFSVTRTIHGQIVRSVTDVTDGDKIETEWPDGRVRSVVEDTSVRPRRSRKPRPDQAGPGLFDSLDPSE
ncbi:MAG: exodeoxyribonuclease VII large subunit [Planctomycetota bacterium]